MENSNLKIVVLECPYDSWDISPTQEMFGKMVSMKLGGFRARHPYGVMPVDAYDYVAIHQLVCEQTPEGLRILMGYKTVSYERCKIHRLAFPMLSVFSGAHAPEHEAAVRSIIDRCEADGIQLAYTGSWTIDPDARRDPELAGRLRSIFEAMYVFCPQTYGFREIVCGCVPRLKTDVLLEEWGQKRFCKDGKPLPPVSVRHLQGDEVVLMHLEKDFSPAVKARVERWRGLWDERIVVGAPRPAVSPFKKAA